MANGDMLAGLTAAGLFGIYADLAYNTYSATNSSPQTTELFAGERTQSLWKYVTLGAVQVAVLGAAGSVLAGNWWPAAGAAAVMVVMHLMYAHALRAGQAKNAAGGAPQASSSAMLSWNNVG